MRKTKVKKTTAKATEPKRLSEHEVNWERARIELILANHAPAEGEVALVEKLKRHYLDDVDYVIAALARLCQYRNTQLHCYHLDHVL